MNKNNIYDVIIVGAGSMGMATGCYLAKQHVRTLLVDAYEPPHAFGSHHGDTRIIRHAYGEGEQYVPLVLRAQQLWEELEQDSPRKIFDQTGVLGIGDEHAPFIQGTIESAHRYSLPVEMIGAEDVNKRWPGIRLPANFVGCFEPASGVLYSENCIQAYKESAENHGADLLTNTTVTNIHHDRGGIKVETREEHYYADKVIVTAGAWTGKLLAPLHLPLQPVRKVFAWFEADRFVYEHPAFPAFFFALPNRTYYGFPSFNGSGLKLGRHDSGQNTDSDAVTRTFGSLESDEADLRDLLHQYMPQASGSLKQGKVCLYTNTPDGDFIIDIHPENPNVIIATGFSGHGFKFSSVVGEILSQMAVNGKTEHDISGFSLSRFSL